MPLLGVTPEQGRLLTAADETPGAPLAALVSHDFWTRTLDGAADVIGRRLTLDGQAVTIVGVLPAGFAFPLQAKPIGVWAPLTAQHMAPQMLSQRGARFLSAIGRLKPGVSIDRAGAEMNTIAARLAAAHPAEDAGYSVQLAPYRDRLVRNVRVALLLLLGAVGFVLLIACANLATLLLARSASRQREMAVRAALGAGRGRLVRQLLTEGLLLALAGGALGLLAARWGLDGLKAISPINVPRLQGVTLDPPVLLFTLLATLLTGVLFSLVPALQLSRGGSGDTLKEVSSRTAGPRTHRARTILVTAEIALAVVLLVGAGLLVRSFAELSHVDPGFHASGVVSLDVSLPRSRYRLPQILTFATGVVDALQGQPAVRGAAIASSLPMSGNDLGLGFTIDNRPPSRPGEHLSAAVFSVSPGYFGTMGIPVVRGRAFTAQDTPTAQPVIIINRTMAERLWPGQNPIGQHMTIGYSIGGAKPDSREIVGVVGDVKGDELTDTPQPQMYTPFAQTPWPFLTVVVRAGSIDGSGRLGGADGRPGPRQRTAGRDGHQPRRVPVALGVAAALQRAVARPVRADGAAARRHRHLWRDGVPRGRAGEGDRDPRRARGLLERPAPARRRPRSADRHRRRRRRPGRRPGRYAAHRQPAVRGRADRRRHVCRCRRRADGRRPAGQLPPRPPRPAGGPGEGVEERVGAN